MDALPDPDSEPKMCERLAALADGELTGPALVQAVAWLDGHPEAADDFRAQQEFGRHGDLVRRSRCPLPARWDAAFAAISAAVLPATGIVRPAPLPDDRFRAPRWMLLTASAGIAACAALLVGLGLNVPRDGGGVGSGLLPDNDDAIVLARNDEIEFLSLPEDAHAYLPLGRHPLSGGIVLANASEVEHHNPGVVEGNLRAHMDLPGEAAETPLIRIFPQQP